MRVITVLPSATEIMLALGARDMVVGVCHCDNYGLDVPVITDRVVGTGEWQGSAALDAEVKAKARSGDDMYDLKKQLLRDCSPDLVISQDLCAVCAVTVGQVKQAMEGYNVNVVSLSPCSLQDVLEDIMKVGTAIGRLDAATTLVADLARRIESVALRAERALEGAEGRRRRVAVVEWTDPIYIGGHWVPQMCRLAGGTQAPLHDRSNDAADALKVESVVAGMRRGLPGLEEDTLSLLPRWGGPGDKSMQVDASQLSAFDPDVVIVVPCGLTLDRSHSELAAASWPRGLRAFTAGDIYVVDGSEMFARPGPALVDALEWMAGVILCDEAMAAKHRETFPCTKFDADRAAGQQTDAGA